MTKQATDEDVLAGFDAEKVRTEKRQACIVIRSIQGNPHETVFRRVIEDLSYSSRAVQTGLEKQGIAVSASSITNHRSTNCACKRLPK